MEGDRQRQVLVVLLLLVRGTRHKERSHYYYGNSLLINDLLAGRCPEE